MTFWHWVWLLTQHFSGCRVMIGRSTAGQSLFYSGGCVESWVLWLHIPDASLIFN